MLTFTHLLRVDTESGGALASFRRPLLVLLERTADLATMMHHPWTYGALVHDTLGLKLNRVVSGFVYILCVCSPIFTIINFFQHLL